MFQNRLASSGSPVDEVVMGALIVFGAYVLKSRWNLARKVLFLNKWLLALFFYMAASVVWSNFPSISLRRYIRCVGALIMVLVVLTERDPLAAIRSLLRRLYMVHIPGSILTIKYVRNIGVAYDWSGQEEDWVGLTTDKNSLGQVAMFSGALWIWQICQDWRRKRKGRMRALALDGMLLFNVALDPARLEECA
jgi:hypothetical protein